MAYVKAVNERYLNWNSIKNVLEYIFRDGNIPLDCVGGYGVIFNGNASTYYVDSIVEQFEAVKIIYKKEGYRLLKHFVIILAPGENVDCAEAVEIAWKFIKCFGDGYQVVFAVHTDTDNIHVHVVLNTTNVISGNNYDRFYESQELNEFLNCIMKNRS